MDHVLPTDLISSQWSRLWGLRAVPILLNLHVAIISCAARSCVTICLCNYTRDDLLDSMRFDNGGMEVECNENHQYKNKTTSFCMQLFPDFHPHSLLVWNTTFLVNFYRKKKSWRAITLETNQLRTKLILTQVQSQSSISKKVTLTWSPQFLLKFLSLKDWFQPPRQIDKEWCVDEVASDCPSH